MNVSVCSVGGHHALKPKRLIRMNQSQSFKPFGLQHISQLTIGVAAVLDDVNLSEIFVSCITWTKLKRLLELVDDKFLKHADTTTGSLLVTPHVLKKEKET